MAHRRRASMREGPLADLFRSTVRDPKESPTEEHPSAPPADEADPTQAAGDRRVGPPPSPSGPEPTPEIDRPDPHPPDPERVRAYRVEERGPAPPEPKQRLSRIFADETHEVEGPIYGRDEPGLGDYHGPPRPQLPVIRVVGIGGAGVNAIK